jgi:hypothetical protein
MDNMVPPPTGAPDPSGLEGAVEAVFAGAPAIKSEDQYKNFGAMLEFYKEAKRECLDGRQAIERLWWRNILYILGRQWIYYDRKRGQWVDKRMARWIPRPVTNKASEVVESLVALFQSIELDATARPVGGEVRNVSTAETIDRLEPFLKDDHDYNHACMIRDFWLVATGNGFLHTYYDKNPQWGTVSLPYSQCQSCGVKHPPQTAYLGVCPTCKVGQMAATDMAMPVGRGRTCAPSPFEIAYPLVYQEFEDTPIVLRMMWKTKRQLENFYGRSFLDKHKITWQRSPQERSLQLMRAIATQTDVSAMSRSHGLGAETDFESDGTTEFELWAKPNEDFPEGLLMRVLGDGENVVLIEDEPALPGPVPFQTKQGEILIPFLHTGFKQFGGKSTANSPLDVICAKVDQLNRLDALIELIVNRSANPVWLEPKGSEIKSFTGEPGLVLKYNALAAGGAKPERLEGANIQGSLFQLRKQILDDIEYLAGTFDVLKGSKPGGVEAFSALQLLVERGQARFTPVFKARGETHRKWLALAVELERQYGPTRRTYAVMTPNKGWTMEHFLNADLQGAVDFIIEDGAQAPKTNLGIRAAIEQAKNLGYLDPADFEQKYYVFTKLGLTFLMPSLDFHVKSALAEQDAFEKWTQDPAALEQFNQQMMVYSQSLQLYTQQTQQATAAGQMVQSQPPDMPEMTPFQGKEYQDGRVHIAEHTKWANSDSARTLFQQMPMLEQAFLRHLELHDILDATRILRQQLAQTQAQMRLGLLLPQPQAGGGGQAMASSNQESGATDSMPAGNNDQGKTGQQVGPA